VAISGLFDVAKGVAAPRTLHLRWPFGHALGEPHKPLQQANVLWKALEIAYDVAQPGQVISPRWPWRRHTYAEPSYRDLLPGESSTTG
jgi:D-proline reductase (dithiol) PrdB